MSDSYYASVRSGESYADATIHTDPDCPDCPGDPRPRPLRAATVESNDGLDRCESCGDGEDVEECDVVKNDGEVCGRERPCPYHDD